MLHLKQIILCLLVCTLLIPSETALMNNHRCRYTEGLSWNDIHHVGGSGLGNVSSIQAAIDEADDGDTIYIYPGIYQENLHIDKSIHLIGQERDTTIIDGSYSGDVITVAAEDVTIQELTIQHSGTSGRDAGIELQGDNASILDIIIRENTIGLFAFVSNHHTMVNNLVTTNKDYGIHLYESTGSLLSENTITANRWGILCIYGIGNHISDNLIDANTITGIWLLRGSGDNTICNNTISHHGKHGILLYLFCNDNTISQNLIDANMKYGIMVGSHWGCDSNHITGNIIRSQGTCGVYLRASSNTLVTDNTFLENNRDATFDDCSSTSWDGNYWGQPRTLPYPIVGKNGLLPSINIDWHPAQTPYDESLPGDNPLTIFATQDESSSRIQSQDGDHPSSFDWRDIDGVDYTSPVKNQAPAPTCETYALCAALETIVHYQVGDNFGCDLSEAHLFFYPGGTCQWGVDVQQPAEYLITHGVPDEGCFPDPHRPYDFPFESLPGWEERTVKIKEWGWVDNTVEAIKSALIDHGPLVICQMTRRDLDLYHGGVYTPRLTSPIQRGHVVAIVGYDDQEQCWIIRNSAGESWGEEGYFRVSYETFDEIYTFIFPFYGGTGILYVDGIYGNLMPDVPTVEIVTPQLFHTYVMGKGFSTMFKRVDDLQRGAPRIVGPITITVAASKADEVAFYLDSELQWTDDEAPFTWETEIPSGLHTLEVIASKGVSFSKDIIDVIGFP